MSRKKIIIFLIVCLAVVIGVYFYIQITTIRGKRFQVTFFDIGQGDSALIRFANGQKMLVDCGVDRKIIQKLGEALPFYDRKIDYLLVTHPDSDHYGGCSEVLKRYKVGIILANGDAKDGDSYWTAWKKNSKLADGYEIIEAPVKKEIAGAEIEFLFPDDNLPLDEKYMKGNNLSIVFRLAFEGKKYFFAGDMEMPLETALVAYYCGNTPFACPALRADYLKIGHHGSDSSSDKKFLEAVSPRVGIISVGRNSFGHPSFRVINKLERIGAEIWRTDELGDIITE